MIQTIVVEMPEDLITQVKEYRHSQSITQAEAIKRLLLAGIEENNHWSKWQSEVQIQLPKTLVEHLDQYRARTTRSDVLRQFLYTAIEAERNEPRLRLDDRLQCHSEASPLANIIRVKGYSFPVTPPA
jgi:metal-responsive CopG/Arc/MetJ family transcriptional regulator